MKTEQELEGGSLLTVSAPSVLELAIRSYQLDEVKTMNALQSAGIVADNCVLARDVAPTDCERAVAAIEKRHLNFVCGNFENRQLAIGNRKF